MWLTILHTVTHAAASIFILLLLRENRKLHAVNARNARYVSELLEERDALLTGRLELRDEIEALEVEVRDLRATQDTKAAKRSESMEILRLEKELREAKRGKP